MARRERLGSRSGLEVREYVYRTRDCFEVDYIEGYEVIRKRVFYEDVVLVTRHGFVPWGRAVTCGVLGGIDLLLALALLSGFRALSLFLLAFGVLLLGLAIACFAVGGETVTIQGKRTQARMNFVLRPRRAREVYRRACRLARERQERLARQAARVAVASAETVTK